MKYGLLLICVLLSACNGRPDLPFEVTRKAFFGSSGSWLDGYSTIVLQRPLKDRNRTYEAVGHRLEDYKFEILTAEAWPTLDHDYREKCMVFTYSYVMSGDDTRIIGTFTDASTGHLIKEWDSHAGGMSSIHSLLRCLDDGLSMFITRTGYDPEEASARPLSWQAR